jgi:sialate O-acetylesterase
MTIRNLVPAIVSVLLALPALGMAADLKLPAIFSDNMVLQAGRKAPIWGKASAGEKITVQYGSRSVDAVADGSGKWSAVLDLSTERGTPFDVTVKGDQSPNPITIKNAIAGEVWLASGQSNMYKPVGPAPQMQPNDNWEQVVADSANPAIRVFTVGMRHSDQPLDDCSGKWEIASPQTTAKFTAAGYFFARDLNRELHVPVGIIHSSWGGTRAEPWISLSGFDQDPDLSQLAKEETQVFAGHPAALKQYDEAVTQWAQAHGYNDPGDAGEQKGFAAPNANTDDWSPAPIGSMRLAPGVHWFRTTVNVPPDWAGKPVTLALGSLVGFDTVYYDGVRVGGIDANSADKVQSGRNYKVPAEKVKGGPATITIRLVNQQPAIGLMPQSWRTLLLCGTSHISFGPWKTKLAVALPPLDPAVLSTYPKLPPDIAPFDAAGHLFNAMINPLIPYAIAGAIWYQGESNADVAPWVLGAHAGNPWYSGEHPDPSPLYRKLLPALINDWRSEWKRRGGTSGDFPFYICQLANYKKKQLQPSESSWAEVRESQRVTLGTVPAAGMAVLIDIGQEKDIHPTDKEDVGARLARWALADTYAHKMEESGPLYQSMKVEGNKVRLTFSHLGGGLVARQLPETYQPASYKPDTLPLVKPMPESPLQGFEVAGPDGKFVWADAAIEGSTVVVSAPSVRQPAAVRYAWADNPTCNLYNSEKLPASPFRTDNWWPEGARTRNASLAR